MRCKMSLKICLEVGAYLVSNWVNVGINQANGPYSNVALLQLSFQNEWNMRGSLLAYVHQTNRYTRL